MIQGKNWQVFQGSNLDVLPTLEDNSVDAIVTDPPYGLSDNKFVAETITRWIQGERDFIPDGKGFMGKYWDAFVPPPALWDECLRVLKPGGHLLAFFGSRTQDIGALSIRLAGFEIRDSIAWMYGSGFPKSLDISKAIDKQAGVEREVIGKRFDGGGGGGVGTFDDDNFVWSRELDVTKAATSEAQQWEGWGTALKPAFEPVIVARKPLIGTVAENVLTYGTGGLNIDGSRIGTEKRKNNINDFSNQHGNQFGNGERIEKLGESEVTGRWPANVILDPYTAELLDEQSGERGGGYGIRGKGGKTYANGKGFANTLEETGQVVGYGDKGGASRFFYVAKASKRDRNEGLEELEATRVWDTSRKPENVGSNTPQNRSTEPRKNFHPTVKPTTLMEYLIKLVTPPGGVVLDPFTGSGSTGKAAILQGFSFIGIELTEEYLPIIEGRLKWAEAKVAEEEAKKDEALF